MTTPLLAGFECGHLGWNGHDLLQTTRHLPDDRMAAHYAIAKAHDMVRARDGLPWRHDAAARLRIAREQGMEVIWDLSHFDPPGDPVGHARAAATLADHGAPFWICPVNEPAMYPALCGMPRHAATGLAMTMAQVARDHHPDVRILTTDPITGIGNRQFESTDALVAAGFVDVVGINYYPHTARTALSKVLVKTARRYGLPVMVAETSWHDGHRGQQRRFPGWNKGDWLRHVLAEVAIATTKGADVVGVCWYPIVDCPPWQAPRSRRRWSHGLIRGDLGIDPVLASAIAGRRDTGQLRFDFGQAAAG
jgi:hypothetical protein